MPPAPNDLAAVRKAAAISFIALTVTAEAIKK